MNEEKNLSNNNFVTLIENPFSALDVTNLNLPQEKTDQNLPQEQASPNACSVLDISELESCLEALIFVSDQPISQTKLHQLLGPEIANEAVQKAIEQLRERYRAYDHGIELAEVGGGFQLRTKPIHASLLKRLSKIRFQKLSRGAMETLAFVAYKQPVMKEEIDKIRGVDSTYFIHLLLEKKMIEISGRSELPGRPILYTTTLDFLHLFGLKDLSALPPLHEIEQMIPALENLKTQDNPDIITMKALVEKISYEDKNANTTRLVDYDPKEDLKILNEIREKISSISITTPFIDEQKQQEAERQANELENTGSQNINNIEAEQLTILPQSGSKQDTAKISLE
ncbi:MAG: SMC-Scp complex subunit ScpB [Deltaproteobacteria bacterium]|nr:SMC-Scp complex subunit ScpB [Deltaproteobacteria bacterium]